MITIETTTYRCNTCGELICQLSDKQFIVRHCKVANKHTIHNRCDINTGSTNTVEEQAIRIIRCVDDFVKATGWQNPARDTMVGVNFHDLMVLIEIARPILSGNARLPKDG